MEMKYHLCFLLITLSLQVLFHFFGEDLEVSCLMQTDFNCFCSNPPRI
uniref:Uncharacterized protein n=1 Tax=Rhizophora mucronata TaxID=61149 RepID=A0A2P2PP12_RHIMU